jgi:glycosyltransferase involved in cell wall biosynthesis
MEKLKKIFIVAPHFPPSALPPAQRARLLVKHLKNLGWFPYIFTSDPQYREEKEDSWMTELAGKNYELFTVKTLDSNKTRKFGVGDLGLRMLPFLYKKLRKKSEELKPDFILYLVPPWYLMLISKRIKKITGVPYGIDFIDPWVVSLPKHAGLKKKVSQKIAAVFEKKATQNADIIYSVSEGINYELQNRYSLSENKPLLAIPYGVEPSDFHINTDTKNNPKLTFRYIGAVWNDAYPVLEALLKSLSVIEKETPVTVEFYGTSYAGKNLAKPQTKKWSDKYQMQKYMSENPLRVSYRQAVELTMTADIILLFGGMQAYYAASKLMGLIASGKPFFALVHKDSFPYKFLKQMNYKYVISYSQGEPPETKINDIVALLRKIIKEKDGFEKFDLTKPLIKKHTALGMTKQFLEPIDTLLDNDRS